jgi:ParB family transcriptional regulator, chromosome partitioning protein
MARRNRELPSTLNASRREARREAVNALLDDTSVIVPTGLPPRRTLPQTLPRQRIRPNPFQPRQKFPNLEELASAMRTHGFTSRLLVRPDPNEPGFFQLVYGERRLRAAELADIQEIPCDIGEYTDDELAEIGLAENIQRAELTPLEEADAFRRLIDTRGYSIRTLAERIGKDKGYVENRLALLRVPEDVQRMVTQRPDSLRAAREIAKVADPVVRHELIAGVIAEQLTDRAVRDRVQEIQTTSTKMATSPRSSAETPPLTREQRALQEDIRRIVASAERYETALTQGRVTLMDLKQYADTLDRTLTAVRQLLHQHDPLIDVSAHADTKADK